jgi:Tol biopolymer transport system component
MDMDGGNLKQLTSGPNEFQPSITPDGKSIVYSKVENNKETLWRVSIDGRYARTVDDLRMLWLCGLAQRRKDCLSL